MRACFTSKNLVGDALNISPALNAWYHQHADWEIDLLTLPNQAAMLYPRMGVPLRLCYNEEDLRPPYDLTFDFDCGTSFGIGDQFKIHQVEAYAKMLDVKIHTIQPLYAPAEDPGWMAAQPKQIVCISPFSRSCSSQSGQPANKMLPWERWVYIVRFLRGLGLPLRILGAREDRAEGLDLSEEEYISGQELNRIALLLRDRTVLLVSIDNGLAHLAASQSCPTFLFYPACLGTHWIVPANPHLVVLQVEPTAVSPAGIMWSMRQGVPKLLEVRMKKE